MSPREFAKDSDLGGRVRRPNALAGRDNLSYAFCGRHETTVLRKGRIRLPVEVTRQLRVAGVEAIWPAILPKEEGLALVPHCEWDRWVLNVQRSFPFLDTPEGRRVYMAPSRPTRWDRDGRIWIPKELRDYANIRGGEPAVVLGLSDHFELWDADVLGEISKRWVPPEWPSAGATKR